MRGTRAVLVTVASALVLAPVAHGNTRTLQDKNDVPGPLDIRSATAGRKGERLLRHTISTYGAWPLRLIGARTPNFFVLALDTQGNMTYDNYVFFYSKPLGLRQLRLGQRAIELPLVHRVDVEE